MCRWIRAVFDREYAVREMVAAIADRDWYRSRCEYLAGIITADELARIEEEQEVLEPGQVSPAGAGGPASDAAGRGRGGERHSPRRPPLPHSLRGLTGGLN